MESECMMCFSNNELEHLNIYIIGREGVWVCNKCKLDITEFVRKNRSENFNKKLITVKQLFKNKSTK